MLQSSSMASSRLWTPLYLDLSNEDLNLSTKFTPKKLLCMFFGDQALQHACIACSRKLVLEWVAATDLEDRAKEEVLF